MPALSSPLVLTPPELNAIAQLAPFIATPRATKRLMNVYRLLRSLLGPEAVVEFEGGGYYTVLLQLALLSGSPEDAPIVFGAVAQSDRATFWEAVEDLRPTNRPPGLAAHMLPIESDSALRIRQLADVILGLREWSPVSLESFAYWLPLTTRFSFIPPPS
jgi:hypothetical protein